MAPLESVRPLRKWNLEAKVETRWRTRREREMEDWEVEEIVDGECLRLGVSLLATSRFRLL
jgi:hypothetical protein